MKRTFTDCGIISCCVQPVIACALLLAVMFFSGKLYGQISVANTTPVVENFDGMGTSTTGALGNSPLNSNWKVQRIATPAWAGGTVDVGQQASTGSPAAGSFYN